MVASSSCSFLSTQTKLFGIAYWITCLCEINKCSWLRPGDSLSLYAHTHIPCVQLAQVGNTPKILFSIFRFGWFLYNFNSFFFYTATNLFFSHNDYNVLLVFFNVSANLRKNIEFLIRVDRVVNDVYAVRLFISFLVLVSFWFWLVFHFSVSHFNLSISFLFLFSL